MVELSRSKVTSRCVLDSNVSASALQPLRLRNRFSHACSFLDVHSRRTASQRRFRVASEISIAKPFYEARVKPIRRCPVKQHWRSILQNLQHAQKICQVKKQISKEYF